VLVAVVSIGAYDSGWLGALIGDSTGLEGSHSSSESAITRYFIIEVAEEPDEDIELGTEYSVSSRY
jgi:hypothetical protein